MRETGGSTSQVPSGKRLEKNPSALAEEGRNVADVRQYTLRFEAFLWKKKGKLMKIVPRMWVVQPLQSFPPSLSSITRKPTLRPALWLNLHITSNKATLSLGKIAPLPPSLSFLFCYLLAPTSDIPIIYSNPMSPQCWRRTST